MSNEPSDDYSRGFRDGKAEAGLARSLRDLPGMAKLTPLEMRVLDQTAELVTAWARLPDRLQEDNAQLELAVHQVQQLVGVRVARRADPQAWRQP